MGKPSPAEAATATPLSVRHSYKGALGHAAMAMGTHATVNAQILPVHSAMDPASFICKPKYLQDPITPKPFGYQQLILHFRTLPLAWTAGSLGQRALLSVHEDTAQGPLGIAILER